MTLDLRMYDVWEEGDGAYYAPRFTVMVVRSARRSMPQYRKDVAVIITDTACSCIADHMADEFRPTAPSPPYHRSWAEGSGDGVQWGEAHPPCGQRYTCRR